MISVVVPTKHNTVDLKECLKGLRGQSYKNFEIIVVAPRNAATVGIAKRHGIRVAYDDAETIGNAYATGAEHAKGEIVAFIDDDAIPPRGWLSRIVKEFQNEAIDVVGGEDLLPPHSTEFQKAAYQIDLARRLDRPVYGEKAAKRLRAVNIAFKRSIFKKVNFDRRLDGLQEPEFLHRLAKAGNRFKFNPGLWVYHKRRGDIKGIFRQIYRNGKAKMSVIKLHNEMVSVIDVLPFAAILYSILMFYLIFLTSDRTFAVLWILPPALYTLLKPLFITMKSGGFRYYLPLTAIIFVRECAYALGIIAGIPRFLNVRSCF